MGLPVRGAHLSCSIFVRLDYYSSRSCCFSVLAILPKLAHHFSDQISHFGLTLGCHDMLCLFVTRSLQSSKTTYSKNQSGPHTFKANHTDMSLGSRGESDRRPPPHKCVTIPGDHRSPPGINTTITEPRTGVGVVFVFLIFFGLSAQF